MSRPDGYFDISDEIRLELGSVDVWVLALSLDDPPDLAAAGLRELLGRYSGIPPGELVISFAPGGKPSLAGSEIEFSLSHTVGLAAYAICSMGPVGIDVEQASSSGTPHGRLFSQAEQDMLRLNPNRFAQMWTAKEAVAKATGAGLFGGAPFDCTTLSEGTIESDEGWNVHPLALGSGFAGSVAWFGRRATVRANRLVKSQLSG